MNDWLRNELSLGVATDAKGKPKLLLAVLLFICDVVWITSQMSGLLPTTKIETKEVEIEDGNIDSIVESKESDLKESPLPELSTQTSLSSQPSSSSAEWPPLQYLTSDWKHELSSEFSKPFFRNLSKFVSEEMSKYQIFPPENKIFESMNLCSLSSVRVVIIGTVHLFENVYSITSS